MLVAAAIWFVQFRVGEELGRSWEEDPSDNDEECKRGGGLRGTCWANVDPGGSPLPNLRFDPRVRARQPFFQRNARLPTEYLPETCIVGVSAADSLGPGPVLLDDAGAGDRSYHVSKLVDRHQAVLAQIQRLGVVRVHQSIHALHTIVDVAERPSLLSVSPDLDLWIAGELGDGHLAADRGWGFF